MTELGTLEEVEECLKRSSDYSFKAILLATNEDWKIQRYFTQYSADLDRLTGKICLMLVLRPVMGMPKGGDDGFVHMLAMVPVDPAYSYDFARDLGVDPTKLPCLVVFNDLEAKPEELAVVSVPNDDGDDLKNRLRLLLSRMAECEGNNEDDRVSCFKSKMDMDWVKSNGKMALKVVLMQALQAGTSKITGGS